MIAKDILPSEPLKEFVKHYRLRHFVFAKGVIPTVKPFPPRPEQCLLFYIRGQETVNSLVDCLEFKREGSILSGQFTHRVDRYISYPEFLMLTVDFKPGALYRLLNIPFLKLLDKDIDAESVFSAELRRVNERLRSAESYFEMICIIEDYLFRLTRNVKIGYSYIDNILSEVTSNPDHTVEWIARNAYMSMRQLERKFDERVGVNPKKFLRIARFNQSYWMHLNFPKLNWYQIAMSCGYTDYQHLVKEYKSFGDAIPSHLFKEEFNSPGRILGLTKLLLLSFSLNSYLGFF